MSNKALISVALAGATACLLTACVTTPESVPGEGAATNGLSVATNVVPAETEQVSAEAEAEVTPKMPDLSAIELKCDTHSDDTFSMALIAAAKALGSQAELDYEKTFCRSGNAFSPMIDTRETCTAHWACGANLANRAMKPLAASLGLEAKELSLPKCDHTWPTNRQAKAWKGIARVVREAMDEGAVVLTSGGWDIGLKNVDGKWQAVGPHGFVFWGAAGIVASADPETGVIRGIHPNGFDDNRIIWRTRMWALKLADAPPTPPDAADRAAVETGVARIEGKTPFKSTKQALYGTAAMAKWADQMEKVPGFCEVCFRPGTQSSQEDAVQNARRMRKSALIVTRFLRRAEDDFPPRAAGHLDSAAIRYERVAELLAPVLDEKGPEHYKKWLGDMDKQAAHARVLREVDRELLEAARSMSKALEVKLPSETESDRTSLRPSAVEIDE